MDPSFCAFPYTDWPTCRVTAATELGPSYWVLVGILVAGTLCGCVPLFITFSQSRSQKISKLVTQTRQLSHTRPRHHADSVPALDRKGSLRARVGIALLCNAILTPDPLGLANMLDSDLVEILNAVITFTLLSVALSLVFRWVRGLLVLTDGLRQLNRVTSIYMASQAVSALVWVFLTIVQVAANQRTARFYKTIPLVYTAVLLLVVYASASIYSMLTLHHLSTSTQTSSTVSSQTLSRVQAMVHTLLLGSAVVLFLVVPLTIERLTAVITAPFYPDLEEVETLLDLLRMASIRLLCLAFAVCVAFMAMPKQERSGSVTSEKTEAKVEECPVSTTVELQMAVLRGDLEAGGLQEKRGLSDHDLSCILDHHRHRHPHESPSPCPISAHDQPPMQDALPIRQLAA